MKMFLLILFIAAARALSQPELILKGVAARLGDLPYTAVLQYAGAGVDRFCTAAIIDKFWLVTAATCFKNQNITDPSNFVVKAGKRSLEEVEASEQVRKISKIIIHDNYNAISGANNLALLELDSSFTFDTFVSAIRFDHHTFPYGYCTFSGWGSFADKEDKDFLHKTKVAVRQEADCKLYFPGKIFPGTFCAGSEKSFYSPCQEDLGGPLTCVDATSKHLAGIVIAMNLDCNKPNFTGAPALYTDVTHHAKWIEDTIGTSSSRANILSLYLITAMVFCSMIV